MVGTKPWKNPLIPRSRKMMPVPCKKPRIRGLADFRSSILFHSTPVSFQRYSFVTEETHKVVLILSNGVTANTDSVIPAPKPATTVRGPDILPDSSCRRVLYWSKATNPGPFSFQSTLRQQLVTHTDASLERIANY